MATLQELIESEIADFFAGFGSPGEPETPEDMQSQLLARITPLFSSMEQEPVYQVLGDGSWTDYSKQQLEDLLESKPSTLFRVAYAAPQLPQPAVMTPDYSQFLSDVMTAAGLLSHGKRDKALATSLSEFCVVERMRMDAPCRAAPLQGAEPVRQSYTLRDGWVAVPVEPTEDMIIAGFEAELREEFRDPEAWEAFEAMSGCEQAAFRAKWCWAAMITAAPQKETE
ncbi:hypothetical protein P0L44_002389 [Escherichia coli]|nr:hypothetical protein [Escherichia coli]